MQSCFLQLQQAGCAWDQGEEGEGGLAGDSRALRRALMAALAADDCLRSSFVGGVACICDNLAMLQRMLLPLQSPPVCWPNSCCWEKLDIACAALRAAHMTTSLLFRNATLATALRGCCSRWTAYSLRYQRAC